MRDRVRKSPSQAEACSTRIAKWLTAGGTDFSLYSKRAMFEAFSAPCSARATQRQLRTETENPWLQLGWWAATTGRASGLAAEAAAVDNVASAPIPADVASTGVAWANPICATIRRQGPDTVHKNVARTGARR